MSDWKHAIRHSGFIQLWEVRDPPDGDLFVAEVEQQIPFEVKRIYFINKLDNPSAVRGKHAHRRLQQVIFAVNGSFELHLDDGRHQCDIAMSNPSRGVLLGPLLWHTMSRFSPDCVILVMASDYYDESDYIRSYHEFVALVRS